MWPPNLELDVKTDWTTFPTLLFYDEDDGRKLDLMLVQGQ